MVSEGPNKMNRRRREGFEEMFDNIMDRLHREGSSEPITIGVLGPARIKNGGRPVELEGSFESFALIGMLSARLGRETSRQAIYEALWAGLDSVAAERTLGSCLEHIRRCFGPTCKPIEAGENTLRLSVGSDVWLDAHELVAAANSSDRIRKVRAMGLYRGEPFQDFPYDGWSFLPREHLRETYVGLARDEAELTAEEGNYRRAADLYAAALDTEPFDEDLYSAAIEINIRIGDLWQAQRQTLRCRDALANIGLAPSSDFVALESQLAPLTHVMQRPSV